MAMLWRLIAMNHKTRFQSMLIQGMRSDEELVFERFHDEVRLGFIIVSQPGYWHTELYDLGFAGLQGNSGERPKFLGRPLHC